MTGIEIGAVVIGGVAVAALKKRRPGLVDEWLLTRKIDAAHQQVQDAIGQARKQMLDRAGAAPSWVHW